MQEFLVISAGYKSSNISVGAAFLSGFKRAGSASFAPTFCHWEFGWHLCIAIKLQFSSPSSGLAVFCDSPHTLAFPIFFQSCKKPFFIFLQVLSSSFQLRPQTHSRDFFFIPGPLEACSLFQSFTFLLTLFLWKHWSFLLFLNKSSF